MGLYKKIHITCLLLALLVFNFACVQNYISSNNKQNNNPTTKYQHKDDLAQEYLFHINKIRNKARKCGNKYFSAAPALKFDDKLHSAAMLHSIDMSTHNSLSHISTNGDNLVRRLSKVDYAWRAIAENIAHNQRSVNEVLTDWLSSPGHCSNLMSPDYQFTGIAQVNWYWTQIFATPRK